MALRASRGLCLCAALTICFVSLNPSYVLVPGRGSLSVQFYFTGILLAHFG